MKFEDYSQNVRMQLRMVQALVLLLLAVLAVRLYVLQIINGRHYAEIAENQRVRLLPIPAPRGAILDRNGRLLVDSRPTYNVVLSNEPLKSINVNDRVDDYSHGLNIERQFVVERLNL